MIIFHKCTWFLTFIADDTIDEGCCFRKDKDKEKRRAWLPMAKRSLWNWMMRKKWKQGKLESLWVAQNYCSLRVYYVWQPRDILFCECLPLWGFNVWRRRKSSDVLLPCLGNNDNLSQMHMIFGDTLPTSWLSYTIDESCGVAVVLLRTKMKEIEVRESMVSRGDKKVVELNDEKEVEVRLVV